jgi:hypothetical protein
VDVERWLGHHGLWCTALFVTKSPAKVLISRDPDPPLGESRRSMDSSLALDKAARELLPLACVCGSQDDNLAAPVSMWEMHLVAFSTPTGYSSPSLVVAPVRCPDISDRISEIEEWARIVDAEHHSSIDIAARRVVSALASRQDPADSLIDAVTAWENLVGTDTETSFRVTASLARLLEPQPGMRLTYRKELGRIYDKRSKVVHGEAVDAGQVATAADGAVKVAVQALRAGYRLGRSWLAMTSRERSDQLLLGGDR